MKKPAEPLYMILSVQEAGRVLGFPADDSTEDVAVVRSRDDRDIWLTVIPSADLGDVWTLVTAPQLTHLRLLGKVEKVYDI